jgi:hypothetical protein
MVRSKQHKEREKLCILIYRNAGKERLHCGHKHQAEEIFHWEHGAQSRYKAIHKICIALSTKTAFTVSII